MKENFDEQAEEEGERKVKQRRKEKGGKKIKIKRQGTLQHNLQINNNR